LQKISESFVALNDDDLIDSLLIIINEDDGDSKRFIMIAYIRFLLVASSNQTIVFLNDLFELTLSKEKRLV
jgi:hypothetical protein